MNQQIGNTLTKGAEKMRLVKLLAVAFVTAVSTFPVFAHPGPERHPTEQELVSLASDREQKSKN